MFSIDPTKHIEMIFKKKNELFCLGNKSAAEFTRFN